MDHDMRNTRRGVEEGNVNPRKLAREIERNGDELEAIIVLDSGVKAELYRAREVVREITLGIGARQDAEYAAIGGCLACGGEGRLWTHYHDGDSVARTCENVAHKLPEGAENLETTFPAAVPTRPARVPTEGEIAALETALAEVRRLETEVARLEAVTKVARGDLVRYTNARARAKFNVTGVKVPVGTEGKVTWVGSPDQDDYPTVGQSWGGRRPLRHAENQDRACVQLPNGDKFYTGVSNLVVLTPLTKVSASQADADADVSRGDRVRLKSNPKVSGWIFWIETKGGRTRLGFKDTRSRSPGQDASHPATWCYACEVERVNS